MRELHVICIPTLKERPPPLILKPWLGLYLPSFLLPQPKPTTPELRFRQKQPPPTKSTSMFRALVRPASTIYRLAAIKATSATVARMPISLTFARTYASAGLARADVEKRVLDILAGFNKVDSNKVIIARHDTRHCCQLGLWMESRRTIKSWTVGTTLAN